jgi:hypothetical protein
MIWKLDPATHTLQLDVSLCTWLRDRTLRNEVQADARILAMVLGAPIDVHDNEGRLLACVGAVMQ